jgi:large subunit ribosomal protein L4
MLSALSVKVRNELLTVVKSFELDRPSTKAIKNFMDAIHAEKTLVVFHSNGDNVARSARNIPNTKVMNVASINVYDLLNSKTLVVTPEVVARLEEVYSK